MQGLENTLAVIRSAINDEVSGQRFYSDAVYSCIDPWAKEVFATLVQEEEEHTRLLLLQYESLTVDGRWLDPEAALADNAEVDITRFSFPEGEPAETLFQPSQAIDRRSDDLTALAYGIDMERRAIDLYGRGAAESTDQAARNTYEYLVDQETEHYQQLKNQWEKLAGIPFGDV